MQAATFLKAKIRNYYRSVVGKLVLQGVADGQKDLLYWQNKFFATGIFYALPFSSICLVVTVLLEAKDRHGYIACFNILALGSIVAVIFSKGISIHLRKILVAVIIVLFAVAMMAFMGSFTLGCTYLFPLSVFIALQFSNRVAYRIIIVNFAICAFFALVLWLKPFELPVLFQNVSLNHWLIYSINFLFMDIVVVVLIRALLTGLDRIMTRQTYLSKKLKSELQEKDLRNLQLKESEAHYRTLFFQSPLPKWIFDTENLQFLQVNEAAVINYGYTKEEFLQMTLPNIHYAGQVPDLLNAVDTPAEEISSYITRHVRKDGKEIDVEVRRSDIFFQGKKARLVIATDITEQVKHTRAIELKNEKLQQIAYMQSHVVRVPLANIIGITDLIMQMGRTEEEKQLFAHLECSVKQLDQVVRQIVQHAENKD